jgi:[protein-PII] uridylyltransferase
VARVSVDNRASATSTVIEIRAADAIGLLYRITRTLADFHLDIRHAKALTLGPEVVDTFYVVTEEQDKVQDGDDVAEIERALLDAVRERD